MIVGGRSGAAGASAGELAPGGDGVVDFYQTQGFEPGSGTAMWQGFEPQPTVCTAVRRAGRRENSIMPNATMHRLANNVKARL